SAWALEPSSLAKNSGIRCGAPKGGGLAKPKPVPAMPPTARAPRRIAIVGGGMAGLTAAYELYRTSELRARHAVTLYQSGVRLGGKLASGRNQEQDLRNEEHGL